MFHGPPTIPGTDPNRVKAVGLPCALTLNRYSEVRHAAVRAAATNVRPSPVATPVSWVARNGSLIVAPRVPVVALTTTMDGCTNQFSATKKAGVPRPAAAACGGPLRSGAERGSRTDAPNATAATAAAAASGISSRPRAGQRLGRRAGRGSPAGRPRTPSVSTVSGRTVSAAAR